jgi:hypothetical protein
MEDILDERGKRYGEFEGHANVSQAIQQIMVSGYAAAHPGANITELRADQREALSMIAHKIGRIINGDPDYADSWVDIAGYAKLVSDRLEKEQADEH